MDRVKIKLGAFRGQIGVICEVTANNKVVVQKGGVKIILFRSDVERQ